MPLSKRHGSGNWWIAYEDADGTVRRMSTGTPDKDQAEVMLAKKLAETNVIKAGRLADKVAFLGERELGVGDRDQRIAQLESMVGGMRQLMAMQYELLRQWVETETARHF